ncbi:hypothetical protein [Streptomyces sp. NBC_01262]|uniref:hypothetical protein n=1 Tax=Streptomyces sp. NBC_01262 TaxID=2903803 RepID=UPI002E2F06FF|nr:hypothetical protein [Streptomyces sp. NBC_01262]
MKSVALAAVAAASWTVVVSGDAPAFPQSAPLSRSDVVAEIDSAMAGAEVGRGGAALLVAGTGKHGTPLTKDCVVTWAAADEGAAQAYSDAVAALRRQGWRPAKHLALEASENTSLVKGGWTIWVNHHFKVQRMTSDSLDLFATDDSC